MSNVNWLGLRTGFPYPTATQDQYGDAIQAWDGSTCFNQEPSGSSDEYIPVYGPGTRFPVAFTLPELAQFYWQVRFAQVYVTSSLVLTPPAGMDVGDDSPAPENITRELDLTFTLGATANYQDWISTGPPGSQEISESVTDTFTANVASEGQLCSLSWSPPSAPPVTGSITASIRFADGPTQHTFAPPAGLDGLAASWDSADTSFGNLAGSDSMVSLTVFAANVNPDFGNNSAPVIIDAEGNYWPCICFLLHGAILPTNITSINAGGSLNEDAGFSLLGKTIQLYNYVDTSTDPDPNGYTFVSYNSSVSASATQYWSYNGTWDENSGELYSMG